MIDYNQVLEDSLDVVEGCMVLELVEGIEITNSELNYLEENAVAGTTTYGELQGMLLELRSKTND